MDNSEEQEGDNYVQASNESSKKYENHPFIKSAAYDREHYDFQEFDDENGAEEQNIKTAGVLGTSLNVFSTIVGTGTLGLPAVLNQTGILVGIIGIILSGLFGVLTGDLILKSKNMSQKTSFIKIAGSAYGKKGYTIVILCQVLAGLAVGMAYLIILGLTGKTLLAGLTGKCSSSDDSRAIVDEEPLYCKEWVYPVGMGILIFPLSFAKSLGALQSLSAIKLFALAAFTLITTGYFIKQVINGDTASNVAVLPDLENMRDCLGSISIVTLTCSYQFNTIPIYKSLKPRNDTNMKMSLFTGSIISMILYILVAVSGYYSFGKDASNLLISFTVDNLGKPLFVIIEGSFFLACVFSFPVIFFEARNSMAEICANIKYKGNAEGKRIGKLGYVIMVLIMHGGVVAVAALSPDLNAIFQINGATTMNGFMYLFPSLFYIKLSESRGTMIRFAKFILIYGLAMMIIGLWSAIAEIIEGN